MSETQENAELSASKTDGTSKKKSADSRAKKPKKAKRKVSSGVAQQAKFPRHSLLKALRIPRAILEQNAGKSCSDKEAAGFVKSGFVGPFQVELSSALKYGLLERPQSGHVALTELARKILRPHAPSDELEGLREAVIKAPDISAVYSHYRGENLPEPQFFQNALVDKFKIPAEKVVDFIAVFKETLQQAKLLEDHNGNPRVIDFSQEANVNHATPTPTLKKLSRDVKVASTDTCFVIMPFAPPIGGYHATIYDPAIRKAGLTPVRADTEIFGTGKIMDQVWSGINGARVLVAELTSRNANVFYELGLAHALRKPVVLVSSNEADVPFDLHHIRVIYYDVNDPFWGEKLIAKVAENILSALKDPDEAIFKPPSERTV